MKKVLVYLSAVALTGTILTSCNNDDDGEVIVLEKASYEFTRDGESTVMYDGQNIRLQMVKELGDSLKNSKTTVEKLESMFAHQQGHNDFSNAMLNESNKNIKSKIASSVAYFEGKSVLSNEIKEDFSQMINNQATIVFPRWNEPASEGVAGVLPDGKRRVNSKGFESDQMFKKGIIGGLILDQSLNNYLVKTMNDDNEEMIPGTNYTKMEHHWDEAFGYIFGGGKTNVTGPDEKGMFPKTNEFIKYVNAVNKNPYFNGIANQIFASFVIGRQAIVNKNYTTRDKAIKAIQANASTVVAVRGVFYLLKGADEIKAGTRTEGFHNLSEGLGFVYSLQFTHNPKTGKPYLSHDEVTSILNNKLLKGNGLWEVSEESIISVAKQIADKFGFTLEQAKADAAE